MSNPLVEKLKKSSWSTIAQETIREIESLEARIETLNRKVASLELENSNLRSEKTDIEIKLERIKGSL